MSTIIRLTTVTCLLHIVGDFCIKPLLVTVYNCTILPVTVFIWNLLHSVHESLTPAVDLVLQIFGIFVSLVASFHLVSIHHGQPPSSDGQPTSSNGQPSGLNGQPHGSYGQPPGSYGQPPGFYGQPPGLKGQPPGSSRYQPTSNLQPPNRNERLSVCNI